MEVVYNGRVDIVYYFIMMGGLSNNERIILYKKYRDSRVIAIFFAPGLVLTTIFVLVDQAILAVIAFSVWLISYGVHILYEAYLAVRAGYHQGRKKFGGYTKIRRGRYAYAVALMEIALGIFFIAVPVLILIYSFTPTKLHHTLLYQLSEGFVHIISK